MTEPETIDAIADRIAVRAHAGQVDKRGAPYIEHVRRVAGTVEPQTAENRAAALLHDTVEDTPVTPEALTAAGMPIAVVTAVELLTRRPGVPAAEYYARIRTDPIALAVKLADVADNSDPRRLADLDPATRDRLTAKYAAARNALTGAPARPGT